MTIESDVALGMDPIKILLEIELVMHPAALESVTVGETVALVIRAESDGVEAAETDIIIKPRVKLHAGDYEQPRIGSVIGAVIDPVVGEGKEIIAVDGMIALDLLGSARAVGTGGVAVETALQHFFARLKRNLSYDF